MRWIIFLVMIIAVALEVVVKLDSVSAEEKKVVAEEKMVRLHAKIDKSEYVYPEMVKIESFLEHNYQPLQDADVKAIVTRPDGSRVTVPLGIIDFTVIGPAGGEYYNVFSDYSGDGQYTILIEAKSNAKTKEGPLFTELPPPGVQPQPPELRAVSPFHLTAQLTFTLKNWSNEDKVPPARVYNLYSEYKPKPTLYWCASGDNGYSGRAARYEVRYVTASEKDIEAIKNDSAWQIATVYPQEIKPKASCSDVSSVGECFEELTIDGLSVGTYFFAIKAYDRNSNASQVSAWEHVVIK